MAAAWIGFAGGVIATVVSAVVALRQTRMAESLARLNADLEAEVNQRAVMLDRSLNAEDVLTRYREPLAAAAFDLQSRLYNVLRLGFFAKFGDGERAEDAVTTTLFRLAQYFGWAEILRRDIQFLSFPEDDDTRKVARLETEIAKRFLSDGYGLALMIWSDEQRGIGERMIVEQQGRILCMGYATFSEHCDDVFVGRRERLRAELLEGSAHARLRDVQHLLCELVEALDPGRLRYTRDLERA